MNKMKYKQMKKPLSFFRITAFINQEAYGGVILIVAAVVAMVWANSAYSASYHHLWHEVEMGFSLGGFELKGALHHWINDGLMALFFFTVGLEIKREIMGGELATVKKASLPIAAAVGGMVFPALFYTVMVLKNPQYLPGWGIPMATDIAFALGLLALLGKKVPLNLKIFLTALAIADDLGAVLVIAVFYTESIDFTEIMMAAGFLAVLLGGNFLGIRKTLFYALIGIGGVWVAFIYSGVHATIAGVLIALTIPARAKTGQNEYIDRLCAFIDKYKKEKPGETTLLTSNQAHLLSDIEQLNKEAHTPLQRIEHALHPVATYFILPIFALGNAGVHIEGSILSMLLHPVSLGIIAGLVLGKFIGISLFARLMVRLKIAILPEGVSWQQIYGVAFLAGIGFTMSIFIADLAFKEDEYKQIAKVGIMAASLLSAIIGLVWLSRPPAEK